MRYRFFLGACLLLAACSTPDRPAKTHAPAPLPAAAGPPDTAAGYAFLRQTIRLSFADSPDVRGDDGWFFSRFAYGLDAQVADKLVPASNPDKHTLVIGGFIKTPASVLREFRQQILHLDSARQRHFTWDPARLGQFVFIDSAGATLRPELAGQVRRVSLAQQDSICRAIAEWNRSPVADRFFSYASLPLFSADGRYALVVRGQTQQSIGWDSIFIYQRTPAGWKILESAQLTTI
jgi:hypothetical protein